MRDIVFVDRYSATGTPRPHSLTACYPCEGMGFYPVYDSRVPPGPDRCVPSAGATPEELAVIDAKIVADGVQEDGWYFIDCPRCKRTRKCSRWETARRFPGWLWRGLVFVWRTRKGGYFGPPYLSLSKRIKIAVRS